MGMMWGGLQNDPNAKPDFLGQKLKDTNSTPIVDIDGARKAKVPEQVLFDTMKAKFGHLYDFDKALKSGVPIDKINSTVASAVNDPQGPYRGEILKGNLGKAKDEAIDQIRPIADGAVTAYSSPFVTPAGGFAAGTATDALLSKLKSKEAQGKDRTTLADMLGVEKGGIGETIANSIQNEGLNELLGKIGDYIGSKVKGVTVPSSVDPGLASLKPTYSQMNGGKNSTSALIENMFNPVGKAKALNESADIARKQVQNLIGLGLTPEDLAARNTPIQRTVESSLINPDTNQPFTKIVEEKAVRPVNLRDQIQATNANIPQLDSTLKDEIKTQRALNSSVAAGLPSENMRRDLSGYRLQQIWQKADNGVNGINGATLLNEWNNPDYAKTKDMLYNKATQDRIGEFFNNVSKISGNPNANTGSYQRMRLTMRGLEIGPAMIGGLISGNPLHGIALATGLAGLELPPMALGRIMTNPASAEILNRLVTGAPLNASEQKAGRLIMSGLNGQVVSLINGQGKRIPAKVQNGQIVPVEGQ